MIFKPFYGTSLFLCPLKSSGNLWFSAVFQEVQKEISAMTWIKDIFNKYVSMLF